MITYHLPFPLGGENENPGGAEVKKELGSISATLSDLLTRVHGLHGQRLVAR